MLYEVILVGGVVASVLIYVVIKKYSQKTCVCPDGTKRYIPLWDNCGDSCVRYPKVLKDFKATAASAATKIGKASTALIDGFQGVSDVSKEIPIDAKKAMDGVRIPRLDLPTTFNPSSIFPQSCNICKVTAQTCGKFQTTCNHTCSKVAKWIGFSWACKYVCKATDVCATFVDPLVNTICKAV